MDWSVGSGVIGHEFFRNLAINDRLFEIPDEIGIISENKVWSQESHLREEASGLLLSLVSSRKGVLTILGVVHVILDWVYTD